MLSRQIVLDTFVQLDLPGKKACSLFMQADPLPVEKTSQVKNCATLLQTPTNEISIEALIITDQGRYQGVAPGQNLLRESTRLQIPAARYANPPTPLPGNAPINEKLEHL